jgi:hypothetical protein
MNRQFVLGSLCAATVGVTVAATRLEAAVKAQDNASNAAYAADVDGAWDDGDDVSGSGFLPWDFSGGFSTGGGPYGALNHFIDGVDFPSAYNDLGSPAFGLGQDPVGYSGSTANAIRRFAQPMAVGDKFSVDIDTPAEFDDYTLLNYPFIGIAFANAAGDNTLLIETGSSAVYGDFPWRFTDATRITTDYGVTAGGSSIAPTSTSDGAVVNLEVLTATTGRVTLDGVPLDVGFQAGAPASVAFFLFDNNAETVPTGDLDDSGIIDSVDYGLWKTGFGTGTEGDADGDGDSDGHDFLIWQRTYGLDVASATLPPSGEHAFYFDNLMIVDSAGLTTAPEPASSALAALALAAAAAGRVRRRMSG